MSNPSGRFEPTTREGFDDGWDRDDPLPPLRTELSIESPRTIITRNQSPDISFDRSINPYRGCEHGCIYCFARPSHAWLGLSPGLDFETRLTMKPGAAELLKQELARRSYRVAPIAIGTNTDPYQPVEAEQRITRALLEVLHSHHHPVTLTTKGTLVERDIDILSDMARARCAQVGITVTTLDPQASRRLEPRVPSPARRLATIERLARAGVPVRVMIAPVVPALTDHEIEAILQAAADAGARSASWILLRLPHEVAPLFREWLAEHYPERAKRVMARIRETRGGRDYDPEWGKRMRGEGVHAALIARRFERAARTTGLHRPLPALHCRAFRVPGDQLSLF